MKLDANPYKGTRDFYPRQSVINWSENIDDQAKQNYIFQTFKHTLDLNGFMQYSSSVIETAEAFTAKSGDELGSNQLYSFMDKGDRKIALRPELTLSIARMVANKFDNLRLPLRWYSIDNCFRYERPQKGRLREFWQVEIDIIGKEAGEVDLEIMRLTVELFLGLGAKANMFKVLYNHRGVLEDWVKLNKWEANKKELFKILDDWFKVELPEKKTKLVELLGDNDAQKVIETVAKEGKAWDEYLELAHKYPEMKLILDIMPTLYPGFTIDFTPAIIRGQAYYTGLIFECFDINTDNPRSLFGGGRFDDLLDLYGKKAPAVGLAPGDTTIHHFLEYWGLYPQDLGKIERVGIIPKSINDINKVYTDILPQLIGENKTFDIDYEYDRSTNKRYETLKKRGCDSIIEL
jgi:histidyl-tRNA synthetase